MKPTQEKLSAETAWTSRQLREAVARCGQRVGPRPTLPAAHLACRDAHVGIVRLAELVATAAGSLSGADLRPLVDDLRAALRVECALEKLVDDLEGIAASYPPPTG